MQVFFLFLLCFFLFFYLKVFEKLCFSLNGSTEFNWENAHFVSCVYFEPDGQCLLVISQDKVKGTEFAKLQFTNRGAFVCFLLARLSLWQVRKAREEEMAVECSFIAPLERTTLVPMFLKRKVFRSKPTVLRALSGGELFRDYVLESLVEVDFPEEVDSVMNLEWPDMVCIFFYLFIYFFFSFFCKVSSLEDALPNLRKVRRLFTVGATAMLGDDAIEGMTWISLLTRHSVKTIEEFYSMKSHGERTLAAGHLVAGKLFGVARESFPPLSAEKTIELWAGRLSLATPLEDLLAPCQRCVLQEINLKKRLLFAGLLTSSTFFTQHIYTN